MCLYPVVTHNTTVEILMTLLKTPINSIEGDGSVKGKVELIVVWAEGQELGELAV